MPSALETRPQTIDPIDSKQMISPLAGLPVPKSMLVDTAKLECEYYDRRPDMEDRNQMIIFGTSGRANGNWRWRSSVEMLSGPAFQSLGELTEPSHRAVDVAPPTASLLGAAS